MKDKVCLICHTAIDMDNEFCEFKHYYKRDSIKSKAYYHVECFRERMRGGAIQNALGKRTMEILNKFEGLAPN